MMEVLAGTLVGTFIGWGIVAVGIMLIAGVVWAINYLTK